MDDFRESEIVSKMKYLGDCEPDPSRTDRALARVKASLLNSDIEQGLVTRGKSRSLWFAAFRYAAAVLVVAGVLFGLRGMQENGGGIRVAYADMVDSVNSARTVSYDQTFYKINGDEVAITYKVSNDGLLRYEGTDGSATITDFYHGRSLVFDPMTQEARRVAFRSRPKRQGVFDHVAWIKQICGADASSVGMEVVDGVEAEVFVSETDDCRTLVWIDVDRGLPVRVERVFAIADMGDLPAAKIYMMESDFGGRENVGFSKSVSTGLTSRTEKIIMSNFKWNAELDADEFAFDIPEGYKVRSEFEDFGGIDGEDLIKALKFWAENSGGKFPETVFDMVDQDKVRDLLVSVWDCDDAPEEELNRAAASAQEIVKAVGFAEDLMLGGEWYYAEGGVELGDIDSVLCVWREADAELYTIVYGDLSMLKDSQIPEVVSNQLNN